MIVAFSFHYLWGETQRGPHYLLRLYIGIAFQHSAFRHVTQLELVSLPRKHDIKALNVPVDDAPVVDVQDAHAHLPSIGPNVFLSQVKSFLFLSVDQTLQVTATCILHYNVQVLPCRVRLKLIKLTGV